MYEIPKDILKEITKKGRGVLVIQLTPYPGDTAFKGDPPTCRISVAVTDSENPQGSTKRSKDLSRYSADEQVVFEVPVENTVGVIARWVKRKKPKNLNITIHAEPINGWEEQYDPFTRTEQLAAGEVREIKVTLKPKDARLGITCRLNKPE